MRVMCDGIDSDYGEERVEELRERENKGRVIGVGGNGMWKKMEMEVECVWGGLCEIREEEYFEYMEREGGMGERGNLFLMREGYDGGIEGLWLGIEGGYFRGVGWVKRGRKDLEEEMERD